MDHGEESGSVKKKHVSTRHSHVSRPPGRKCLSSSRWGLLLILVTYVSKMRTETQALVPVKSLLKEVIRMYTLKPRRSPDVSDDDLMAMVQDNKEEAGFYMMEESMGILM